MRRKHWFQATALLLILIAGVTVVKIRGPKQVIRCMPASDAESSIYKLLDAFVVLNYEVGPKLPAGTVMTHWVEYYTFGEREDIAKRSITLRDDSERLPIALVAQELEEQEVWYVIVGADTQSARLPKFVHTVTSTRWEWNRRLQYGKPMLLAYGLRGVEQTGTGGKVHIVDPFEVESVEDWLHNDNVWAFKIQIDRP